jgi:hypothetical protein
MPIFGGQKSLASRADKAVKAVFKQQKPSKVSGGLIGKVEFAEYRIGQCHLRIKDDPAAEDILIEMRPWPHAHHDRDQVDPALMFWPDNLIVELLTGELLEPMAERTTEALAARLTRLKEAANHVIESDRPEEILRALIPEDADPIPQVES